MRTIAIGTVLALGITALNAAAAQLVAVKSVAAHDGYQYAWSPDEANVVLSRAGIVVVLRPGALVYQVNDRNEVADAAPSFSHGDLYVTPWLANHLEVLAQRYSSTAPQGTDRVAATDPSAQGAISLEARQLQGAEAITVDGSAPPNAPVTITLLAIVSSEVPTILVSRHDVITDVSGRFGAVIPIASAYERGTILRVIATSLPGVGSASAQLVTGAPNDGVDVPLEH
jgi:hypothetical protein